jgi:hypothetical protein
LSNLAKKRHVLVLHLQFLSDYGGEWRTNDIRQLTKWKMEIYFHFKGGRLLRLETKKAFSIRAHIIGAKTKVKMWLDVCSI